MKHLLIIILTCAFGFYSNLYANSGTPVSRVKHKLDSLFKSYAEADRVHGSLLVSKNDDILFMGAKGQSNESVSNSSTSLFKIGSLTKAFTSILILKLMEEGLIDPKRKVTDYLPDYNNEYGNRITIENLLTHSSGLQNYTMQPEIRTLHASGAKPKQLVEAFEKDTLLFEPGARFSYSNSAFTLLGYIAEKITGFTYAELLDQYIFDPLEMKTTSYYNEKSLKTLSYSLSGNVAQVYNIHMSIPYAAGAVQSTAKDMHKFQLAIRTTDYLNEESKSLLFKDNEYHYSFGWFIDNDNWLDSDGNNVLVATHGGKVPGFHSRMTLKVDEGIFINSLNNTNQAALRELHADILKIFGVNSIEQQH